MEEELCLIFSGAEPETPSTSSVLESVIVLLDSGLKSEEGDVRLLARPVELHEAPVSGHKQTHKPRTAGQD